MSRLSRWIPHNHPQHSTPLPSLSPLFTRPSIRQPFLFKSLSKSAGIGTSQPCDRRRNKSSCSSSTTTATTTTPSPASLRFWTSRQAWKRASLNTFRCLVGCSLGDFSTLWLLQVYSPDLGVGNIMACSSMSSILSHTHPLSPHPNKCSHTRISGCRPLHFPPPRNRPPPHRQGPPPLAPSRSHRRSHELRVHAGHGIGPECRRLPPDGGCRRAVGPPVLACRWRVPRCGVPGPSALQLSEAEEVWEGLPLVLLWS